MSIISPFTLILHKNKDLLQGAVGTHQVCYVTWGVQGSAWGPDPGAARGRVGWGVPPVRALREWPHQAGGAAATTSFPRGTRPPGSGGLRAGGGAVGRETPPGCPGAGGPTPGSSTRRVAHPSAPGTPTQSQRVAAPPARGRAPCRRGTPGQNGGLECACPA